MSQPRIPPLPFALPDAADAAALARAGAYLARAGTQAASQLLAAPADAALLMAVRDEFLASAALCEGLLDLATDAEAPPSYRLPGV